MSRARHRQCRATVLLASSNVQAFGRLPARLLCPSADFCAAITRLATSSAPNTRHDTDLPR